MLAVILIVALFVLLGLGVFLVAVRGGWASAGRAPAVPSRGRSAGLNLVLLIVYAGLGITLPLLLLTGNHANASSQIAGVKLNAADRRGLELFGEHCRVCHTLSEANAVGKVGPNLDQLKPPASLVLHTIQYGCLQNPPSPSDPTTCLGFGAMPANVVEGQDAQDVANFVAKVAGKQ